MADVSRRSWERAALAALLAATGLGYLLNLDASPYGNSFYAAAVQAGSSNWKAFFFGSLDSGNLITVDKPPASLWVMDLSTRLFGFGTWSLLVPQVLMAVAAVALLHATVRRVAGPVPALLAGGLLAVTPVVVLMFRYDNPDALLVLLLVAAGYTTVRAVQTASVRWLLLTGAAVGLGFLTKELQAFLAVPGLALAYLWAAPASVGRRVLHLLAAGAALVAAAGWWVLAVALWPAGDRPWIGGSTDNSEIGRALGYNGLSRVLGSSAPGPAVPPAARHLTEHATAASTPGFGVGPGPFRLLGDDVGGQVSWLLPAALLLLVAGLWATRRAPRTDLSRAALLLFGGELIAGGVVLSLMQGLFHSYYTLVLAPPIAGLVAVGGAAVWRTLPARGARAVLAAAVGGTAAWACVLLERTPEFAPGLAPLVLVAGLLAALALLAPAGMRGRLGAVVAGAAVLAALAGPVAFAADTVATPHTGASTSAGPRIVPPDPRTVAAGQHGPGQHSAGQHSAGQHSAGQHGPGPGRRTEPTRGGSGPSPALVTLLADADTRWAAATPGSANAAALELASGSPVMAIGGYSGTDPVPSLARFRADVAAHEVHWFIAAPGRPHGGPAGAGAQISGWVGHHFRASRVGGSTVYDLLPAEPTAPKA